MSLNIGLLFLTGALVNGPYALITTAVSAKLGMDSTLSENTKALSTVTAIIDGTGSIGEFWMSRVHSGILTSVRIVTMRSISMDFS